MGASDKQSKSSGNPRHRELTLEGLGVSGGIAIGPGYAVEVQHPQAPEYTIEKDEIDFEIGRFEDAVADARKQLENLKAKSHSLPDTAAEDIGYLLDAHAAMLSSSRLLKGVEDRITTQFINAEAAVERTIEDIIRQFSEIDDPYIAERMEDVREVGDRLIRILLDSPYTSLASVPEGGIVLAAEITPSDTALLDPRKIAGFATVRGGAAGHSAVIARSLGLPAVLGIANLLEGAPHGDTVIIDGRNGKVIINPGKATLEKYKALKQQLDQEQVRLMALKDQPAETRDRVQITLRANLEIPREQETAKEAGADGIGLFRTEFMYMNRTDIPEEDEQYEVYARAVKAAGGAPVTFRTLDIGGDKIAHSLNMYLGDNVNPALGMRAVRLSLKRPDLLKTQFAAMLRAGAHGPVKILLPLVTTAGEVRTARQLLFETAEELAEKNIEIADPLPDLGVMIEIPAAALSADSLAVVSDFFALGTNDLIQYTLAIDRGNDQVASFYDPLNPAVLRLIQFTIEAALRARIPVSICGEMGADPRYTGLLLGLGIREMSMGPGSVPVIKNRIREIDMVSAARHAQMVMDQYDSGRIQTLVNEFNRDG